MRSSVIVALTALVGFSAAQTQLAACAQGCVVLPENCNGDPSCICNDKQWIADISCCVYKACPVSDQQAALAYAKTFCTPVGATLPDSASCANETTSSTTSAAAGASSSMSASMSGSMSASMSASMSQSMSAAGSATSAAAAATSNAAYKLPEQGFGLLGALFGAVALL